MVIDDEDAPPLIGGVALRGLRGNGHFLFVGRAEGKKGRPMNGKSPRTKNFVG
jgi:hypothetical protein